MQKEPTSAFFIAQIGEWPHPESRLYADGEAVYRYDFDTDAWVKIDPPVDPAHVEFWMDRMFFQGEQWSPFA